MPITKVNSLGITNPVAFSAGTVSLPSITTSGDTNTGVFFPSADTIAFTEGGAEAMRITSGGNLNIGNSRNLNSVQLLAGTNGAPYEGIGVNNALIMSRGAAGDCYFRSNTSIAENYIINGTAETISMNAGEIAFSNAASGTAGNPISFTTRMSINASGNLILVGSTAQKASGTTWSNPSDTRLKDNKQNYTKGLNELLQINVKTWEWNGKAGTTEGTTGIGVIADEIEVLLPNTVDTYKAKLNINDTEETDVKRFDATEITWLLLNSIKEQQAIIEQLKTRLTALESK
jgi:hypothetical protein